MSTADGQCDRSGWRILIAGTGGQGVLTAARLLCDCFVARGHHVVSGQLHGMAQRGGAVQSSVIVDGGISPVIPSGRADFLVGFEPVETARALPFVSSDTVVYMNTTPVIPFVLAQRLVLKQPGAEYPDVGQLADRMRAVAPHTFTFDATRCAIEAGSVKALNMVMLGCLLGSGGLPCTAEDFWNIVSETMPARLREVNTKAFLNGTELAATMHAGGGVS
ncbi:MAG: indolepyruvate oxidoreductase subunit beta [Planctomycetes bacterium]|nr:indolepyruvate oxidoreductase subunit beta [Planctomycetota bacterium]